MATCKLRGKILVKKPLKTDQSDKIIIFYIIISAAKKWLINPFCRLIGIRYTSLSPTRVLISH